MAKRKMISNSNLLLTVVPLILAMLLSCHVPTYALAPMVMDRRSWASLQLLQLVSDMPMQIQQQQRQQLKPVAEITDKLFMDIRISRQDGTFYVRDDLPDTFENRVMGFRLNFGLFGTVAPNHVQKFLSYVIDADKEDIDNPLPSYSRSLFTALDQASGLLVGGTIPSLRITEIGGGSALQYGARVIPTSLWLERPNRATSSSTPPPLPKLSHEVKGLLTHKNLDITPTFAITTRPNPTLDSTHTVFGQLLWNEEIAQFLDIIQEFPTYSMERPKYDDNYVAASFFNAQREFFRGAAKSLGDTRVDKIYEGKLLRRIEVTRLGRL